MSNEQTHTAQQQTEYARLWRMHFGQVVLSVRPKVRAKGSHLVVLYTILDVDESHHLEFLG